MIADLSGAIYDLAVVLDTVVVDDLVAGRLDRREVLLGVGRRGNELLGEGRFACAMSAEPSLRGYHFGKAHLPTLGAPMITTFLFILAAMIFACNRS